MPQVMEELPLQVNRLKNSRLILVQVEQGARLPTNGGHDVGLLAFTSAKTHGAILLSGN